MKGLLNKDIDVKKELLLEKIMGNIEEQVSKRWSRIQKKRIYNFLELPNFDLLVTDGGQILD